MTGSAEIAARARALGLHLLGGLHPGPDEPVPAGTATLLLLGPDGPRWEAAFAAAPEAEDGRPDPIDRWSRRVVGALAAASGGSALFPFEGPPWLPVLRWAAATGRAFPSPVGMTVHAEAGLWVSVRGILALPRRLDLPPPLPRPCEACAARPCLAACPVSAFAGGRYDAAACRGHLAGAGRETCLAGGCLVRHACPAGAGFRPLPVQAARHMAAFLTAGRPAAGQEDGVAGAVPR